MVGSYLLQMNLRFGHGSTSARAGHGLGEGQGESGRGNENGNGESHEAPLLAPPPLPPPPPMIHAEMMAEMLAAWRELACALEILAQVISGFARGGPWRQWRERGWCSWSRGALFLPGFLEDAPTHVHVDC